MPNRREFVKSAALLAAAGLLGSCESEEPSTITGPQNLPNIGLGLFTIPFLLEHDFRGTLEMLAKIGYTELEFFGPYSHSVQAAKDYWAPIAGQMGMEKSGYYGHSPKELRSILDKNGMTAPSMHADMGTLTENIEELIEAAQIVGHKYAGIAAIPPEMRASLDDYRRIADVFNEIGLKLSEGGMKFLYHNHGYGLSETEGEIPFNLLVDRTDADLVALELDVYWFTAGRADIMEYLKSYAGRFKMMHVKDMSELVHFAGDGGDPQQWMELFPKMADAGSGILDLEGIIKAAYQSGVEHFYLEKDLTSSPSKTLKSSYDFLSQIEV